MLAPLEARIWNAGTPVWGGVIAANRFRLCPPGETGHWSRASGCANAPASGYVQGGDGNSAVQLTGAAGTDFDLALFKYSGSSWVKVAQSNGNTSTESISYNGTAGYYYVQVKSYSGSGAYAVKYTFPPI